MRGGDPVGLIGIAALAVGFFLLLVAVLVTRWRAGGDRPESARSWQSIGGIGLQALSFAVVGLGPIHVTLEPLSGRAIVEAAFVALLLAATLWLFGWAARALGRNWSLAARTRADHRLVENGPFAWMRNPIYVALLLAVVALAVGVGHAAHLIAGLPLYALGTWLRVSEEERLLRLRFGTAYDDYADRVTRFMPGLF